MCVVLVTIAAALGTGERLARAQETEIEGDPAESDGDPVAHPATQSIAAPPPSWADGRDRLFVASLVDVGFLFLRPRFHVGWGRPHHQWLGVEANPILSSSTLGAYAGIRAAVPYGDLRVGARWRYAFQRAFLDPQDSFSHRDVSRRSGPAAAYISYEAQLTFGVPAGRGSFRFEATGTLLRGLPEGKWVFEDTIRVVAAPPLIWGIEIGYIFKTGPKHRGRLGPVVELVVIPERDDAVIVRGGFVVSLNLWKHLQLRGRFTPVWSSPDSLGLSGGDSFLIGLRYKWATGL